jgi:hypothetical protein
MNALRLPAVEELAFELDDNVQKLIKEAEARFNRKHDLEVRIYHLHQKTCYIFIFIFFIRYYYA